MRGTELRTIAKRGVTALETHAKVVIIGGGVVGCSILFHLAKFGWKDSILLERVGAHERLELACGGADPHDQLGSEHQPAAGLHDQSVQGDRGDLRPFDRHAFHGRLLSGIEPGLVRLSEARALQGALHGAGSGVHQRRGGGAPSSAHRSEALHCRAVGSAGRRLDPSGVVYAYAKAARVHGAKYYTHTPVLSTRQRADGSWDVETPQGTINAEIVVNAAGLWAREVGQDGWCPPAGAADGAPLPDHPGDPADRRANEIRRATSGRDRLRSEYLFPAGAQRHAARHLRAEVDALEGRRNAVRTSGTSCCSRISIGSPIDWSWRSSAFRRSAQAGIKTVVNGPFTFGPDGNPMIGPVPGHDQLLGRGRRDGGLLPGGRRRPVPRRVDDRRRALHRCVGDGHCALRQFRHAGLGNGQVLGELRASLRDDLPERDPAEGPQAEDHGALRSLRRTRCRHGTSFGLEHALWFADGRKDAHEVPSFSRNRSHDYVAAEVRAVRENVGAIEIANFGKHEFKGPGAREFLGRMLAGHLPKPGRVALNPMLTPKGQLYGDLTLSCLDEEHFLLLGSGAAQEMHRRWFEAHLPEKGVAYRNVSDALHGFALSGPRSRELLQRITREDVSAAGMKFRDIRRAFVGGVPAYLLRLSFSGELGYEIYCEPQFHIALWEQIEAAGTDFGLKLYGARALMSLRLEKNWGVWTLDYRPDYTAAESGLDAFIDWQREFTGRDAAMAERDRGPQRRLMSLVVETSDRDVVGDEAILKEISAWATSLQGAMHTTCAAPWRWATCRRTAALMVPGCQWRSTASSIRRAWLLARLTTRVAAGCGPDPQVLRHTGRAPASMPWPHREDHGTRRSTRASRSRDFLRGPSAPADARDLRLAAGVIAHVPHATHRRIG